MAHGEVKKASKTSSIRVGSRERVMLDTLAVKAAELGCATIEYLFSAEGPAKQELEATVVAMASDLKASLEAWDGMGVEEEDDV